MKEKDDVLKTFKEFDVSKCEALLLSKKNLKDKKKLEEFIKKMNSLLNNIEKNELKYDDNLTKFVCETIEHIFTDRKCGDLKKSIAILILKPYFNDDEELIGKFIELILEKITKSTKFSRIKNKIGGFFFQLLNILAKL